jgi:Ca-activated chloride channel family protein
MWPVALLLVLVVPAVLGSYLWKLHRRRQQAVRYSSVALLRSEIPKGSRWRRRVPIALLLASLGVLALASSRPHVVRNVPVGRRSIILAIDVSRSMCSSDVPPNRLSVAQAAARRFVEDQADGTRIGIVVFAGFAQLVVSPTTEREPLLAAIDGLTVGLPTAIGAAMLKSLDAIAEVNPKVAPVGDAPIGDVGTAGANGFVPDIVVLLTDGANTRGIGPLDAVPYAIERGVRVFTIGFGTSQPAALTCSREQLGGASLGDGAFRGSGGRGRSSLVADEATLKAVAHETGGFYYRAEDADQLQRVLSDLPNDVEIQKEELEISAIFAAAGALLAASAIVASIRWSPYPA